VWTRQRRMPLILDRSSGKKLWGILSCYGTSNPTTETGTNLIDENNLPAGKVKHQKFNLIHLKSTTYKQQSTQKSPIFNVLDWLHSENRLECSTTFFSLGKSQIKLFKATAHLIDMKARASELPPSRGVFRASCGIASKMGECFDQLVFVTHGNEYS
jgi:hypothetical protein